MICCELITNTFEFCEEQRNNLSNQHLKKLCSTSCFRPRLFPNTSTGPKFLVGKLTSITPEGSAVDQRIAFLSQKAILKVCECYIRQNLYIQIPTHHPIYIYIYIHTTFLRKKQTTSIFSLQLEVIWRINLKKGIFRKVTSRLTHSSVCVTLEFWSKNCFVPFMEIETVPLPSNKKNSADVLLSATTKPLNTVPFPTLLVLTCNVSPEFSVFSVFKTSNMV